MSEWAVGSRLVGLAGSERSCSRLSAAQDLGTEIRLLSHLHLAPAPRLCSRLPPLSTQPEAQERLCPPPIADVTPSPGPERLEEPSPVCSPATAASSVRLGDESQVAGPPCSCCCSPPVHRCAASPQGNCELAPVGPQGQGHGGNQTANWEGAEPETCLCQLLAGPPGFPSVWSQDAPAQDASHGFHCKAGGSTLWYPEHSRHPSFKVISPHSRQGIPHLPSLSHIAVASTLPAPPLLSPQRQFLHPASSLQELYPLWLHPQRQTSSHLSAVS